MAVFWEPGDPAMMMACAACGDVATLLRVDHHTVTVHGRRGILITYPWYETEDDEEHIAKVIFNPSPPHLAFDPDAVRQVVQRHPAAPPEVQHVIDGMSWVQPPLTVKTEPDA